MGFSYGNLTHLKSQECLGMVKSEIQTQNRFSNSYMEDIAATQQYYRYLLPDPPIPFNILSRILLLSTCMDQNKLISLN